MAYGPRRRGRLATGGCIFGSPYASWLRGHGAFVFPGEWRTFPVDLLAGLQGEGATHGGRLPRLLMGRALGPFASWLSSRLPRGGRDMASPSGGTFPGGQGPGLLHEGSIEQAPSASMAVEEPPPGMGGRYGDLWRFASSLFGLAGGSKRGSEGATFPGSWGGRAFGRRPLRALPPPPGGLVTWLYDFSNDQVRQMSLSFSKKWPTLYGVFVVHGPPPYKNCPPEQFLATSTAFWIFTPQMGSVSLCRSDPGPTVRG